MLFFLQYWLLKKICRNFIYALLLAVVPLVAGNTDNDNKERDKESRFTSGTLLSVAIPLGEGSGDVNIGYGVASFVEFACSSNFALRSRVEYLNFVSKKNSNCSWDITGLLIDGIYKFKPHTTEIYLLVGVGYMINKIELKIGSGLDGGTTYSGTENSFAASAGFGYKFNKKYGVEVKYTYNKNHSDLSFLQTSFSFRL